MEQNRLITLKLIGFNEIDRNNLSSILTLAARLLKKKWHIVNVDDADFFLFSVEASADPSIAEKLKLFPPERCLFCSIQPELQTKYTLPVDEKHIPRLSVLVQLFNQLTENSDSVAEINTPEKNLIQTEQSFEAFFDAQDGLLGHLLATEHERFIICLNEPVNYPSLYIDVEINAYYSQNNLEQLNPYLLESENLNIKLCSKIEIEYFITFEHLKPKPLKDLIWYIAIKTSAGKVIKGHANTDIVTLKSWPDLRLFKCVDYAKIATFMKNNAAPLEMIAEYTDIPLAEVNNFYNACYLMGLIEKRNQIEINKKNLSNERLSLLSKINARLK
jgi:hypothetical protein